MLSNKMNRSLSMPVKPRNDDLQDQLKRYDYTDELDNEEYKYKTNNLLYSSYYKKRYHNQPESESSGNQSVFLYKHKRYSKESKGYSYNSSTNELSNIENLEENDQFLYYKNKNFIRNEFNLSKRLINKNGYQNVKFKNASKYSLKYFKDIITTLIDQHWEHTLFCFAVLSLSTWFGFALLWYLIGNIHGDFDVDELPLKSLNNTFKPCVVGVKSMTGMFLHSVEISSTIGFGERYPTDECPEGVILFVIQIIISIGIDGAMVAVVYAKLAKPIRLITKFTFSKTACVHLRDSKLCFVFRVCDPREQKSIDTKIRVYLVTDIETAEGETIKVNKELQIVGNGTGLVTWPETICHIIDQKSPFYNYTGQDFNTKSYEILVTLVGHSPITGLQTESRTSYLPQEITWGQRFTNIIFYDPSKFNYIIDYDNFHKTYAIDTSSESAYQLEKKFELTKYKK